MLHRKNLENISPLVLANKPASSSSKPTASQEKRECEHQIFNYEKISQASINYKIRNHKVHYNFKIRICNDCRHNILNNSKLKYKDNIALQAKRLMHQKDDNHQPGVIAAYPARLGFLYEPRDLHICFMFIC